MQLTMRTVCLSKGLIRTHPANGVFNKDTTAGEGGVVGHVFRRTVFTTRLFTGRKGQRLQGVASLVATLTDSAQADWQALKHAAAFDQVDSGYWSGLAVGNIPKLAR